MDPLNGCPEGANAAATIGKSVQEILSDLTLAVRQQERSAANDRIREQQSEINRLINEVIELRKVVGDAAAIKVAKSAVDVRQLLYLFSQESLTGVVANNKFECEAIVTRNGWEQAPNGLWQRGQRKGMVLAGALSECLRELWS